MHMIFIRMTHTIRQGINLPEYLETQKLVRIFGRTRYAAIQNFKLLALVTKEIQGVVVVSSQPKTTILFISYAQKVVLTVVGSVHAL